MSEMMPCLTFQIVQSMSKAEMYSLSISNIIPGCTWPVKDIALFARQ